MSTATIVAGFPGIGKSYFVRQNPHKRILDMEPTPYRKDLAWPMNYILDIWKNIDIYNLIFIATYPEVVNELLSQEMSVIIIYPEKSLQSVYEALYLERKNHQNVVDILMWNFVTNVNNLANIQGGIHITLGPQQYLSDVIHLK